MSFKRLSSYLIILLLVFSVSAGMAQKTPKPKPAPVDPVVQKIIDIGTTDNQVMVWVDVASNRFGGRYTGTDAYNNATAWALWQFKQWGLEAKLDEAGEVPVGFNRGPWFGKMIKPTEKALYFGTPTQTAGTKGVQRGPVVIAPAKDEELDAMKDKLKGAWILIGGENNGFARDGRRNSQMSAATKKMAEAGALGTIQLTKEPIKMMDGQILSWDQLPVLPDIKLTEKQYNEIKDLVGKGETVELEFDIRNWFKMGPVKYHNVVAWIPGTVYPDEYVVLGGHFDCFDSATGGVDDGSGYSPGMEAIRILAKAGAKPKRSIMMILFAAEENGILGSQAWLKNNPEMIGKISAMMNRDGSPSAIIGASVPSNWYNDFVKITEPLKNLNPKFPFELKKNEYPSVKAERPSGTDSSAFSMQGVPTLGFQTKSDYNYGRAWHTLLDTYNEVVPYTEHQQHSALAIAIVAYGIANLDKPLSRDNYFLPEGLYADISFPQKEADAEPLRIITAFDYQNAPIHTANFLRIIEGPGVAPGAQPPAAARPAGPGPGGQRQAPLPIGKITAVAGGVLSAEISSEAQKSVAGVALPKETNAVLKHNISGILGMTGGNQFYLTLKGKSDYDKKYPAIGKIIAGESVLKKLKKDDPIGRVRIIRVGQAAKDFKTDNEAFKKLLEKAGK